MLKTGILQDYGICLSPTHVFTSTGTFSATLTVINEDGESKTVLTSVVINQSVSQGNNAKEYSFFNLEIPFPNYQYRCISCSVGNHYWFYSQDEPRVGKKSYMQKNLKTRVKKKYKCWKQVMDVDAQDLLFEVFCTRAISL
jgi:hypothetical protein